MGLTSLSDSGVGQISFLANPNHCSRFRDEHVTQHRPMRVRPGTLLGLLGKRCLPFCGGQDGAVAYHLITRGRSLPGQEAITEEENEAIPTASLGPWIQPYLKLLIYGFQSYTR